MKKSQINNIANVAFKKLMNNSNISNVFKKKKKKIGGMIEFREARNIFLAYLSSAYQIYHGQIDTRTDRLTETRDASFLCF